MINKDSHISQVDGGKVWTPPKKEVSIPSSPTYTRSYNSWTSLITTVGLIVCMLVVAASIFYVPTLYKNIREHQASNSSVETKTNVGEIGLMFPSGQIRTPQ